MQSKDIPIKRNEKQKYEVRFVKGSKDMQQLLKELVVYRMNKKIREQ